MLSFLVPTPLRIDGLRVSIFPNDHPPPHVHVFKAGNEALFFLDCPSGPPTLRSDYGFGERELKQIREALKPHIVDLCAKWEEIHGNKR